MNSPTALHHPSEKHDPAEKLIRMAKEIADFFKAYPEDKAAASIAQHINRYWTPGMREQFLDATDASGLNLPALLLAARNKIKRSKD
jgi:formate dehydrogenase subunit delta